LKTVTVILPTYNEKENIVHVIEQLAENLKNYDYEIIVVDDNSPDGTADVAESLKNKYPVKVIRRPRKLGLTSAIYDGVINASGDVIVVMDADLQHPPSLVPKLVSKLDNCDIVIASRYIKGGGIQEWSLIRRIVSIGAILIARILLSECRTVRDPVSGFFAARREMLIRWKPITPEGYKALVEILATVKPRNVCEEPYVFKSRGRGSSKLSSKIILSYIKLFFKLRGWALILILMAVIAVIVALLIVIHS
jgi:Glycosyltransferases involved in cell wall biogenesis